MKIEKFLCDKEGCKNERAGDRSLHLYLNSTPGGSGNGYEHWSACFDLCAKHLLDLLQLLLDGFKANENETKRFLSEKGIKWESR